MARGKIEKRGQRRRKIKPVILIVTEGSQTEPKYFEHYRNRQTNIDIRVVGSRTSGGETDYLSLIRKAVEYQNKNQISVSEGDSVWVVADGDVNYNNPDPITAKDSLLSKARKMADAKGIQIALSNPCFEFWYLLHFQYTTKFFKDYPAVKNALTTYLPDYEKAGDVYNQLTRYVLSNVSLVCSGSVILSHKDTVMNSMLKRIAANIKIIFRAVPNFFNSSLIRCAILFSLLCELKEIIFQSVLFAP